MLCWILQSSKNKWILLRRRGNNIHIVREGNMQRGEEASSPFLPSRVLEISSFALTNKLAPATQGIIIFFLGKWVFGLEDDVL